ncbi:hypothetical protein [Flammeovirga sp. OC4]|uniref:hypothetical protein n=1 Tax=Flammeovirga sp. OC4 TaxID=1382345 RepID=UPI0005C52F21|nr:hypothetical protein [Flammeovirga sp. OC4]
MGKRYKPKKATSTFGGVAFRFNNWALMQAMIDQGKQKAIEAKEEGTEIEINMTDDGSFSNEMIENYMYFSQRTYKKEDFILWLQDQDMMTIQKLFSEAGKSIMDHDHVLQSQVKENKEGKKKLKKTSGSVSLQKQEPDTE